MGMKASEIEKFIKDAFPDAEIEMKDLAGDDNHWAATVKSAAFKGKSRVRAAPDGLCRAEGQYGRRAACPAAADRRPKTDTRAFDSMPEIAPFQLARQRAKASLSRRATKALRNPVSSQSGRVMPGLASTGGLMMRAPRGDFFRASPRHRYSAHPRTARSRP